MLYLLNTCEEGDTLNIIGSEIIAKGNLSSTVKVSNWYMRHVMATNVISPTPI